MTHIIEVRKKCGYCGKVRGSAKLHMDRGMSYTFGGESWCGNCDQHTHTICNVTLME